MPKIRKKRSFVEMLGKVGLTITEFCRIFGTARTTVWRWDQPGNEAPVWAWRALLLVYAVNPVEEHRRQRQRALDGDINELFADWFGT